LFITTLKRTAPYAFTRARTQQNLYSSLQGEEVCEMAQEEVGVVAANKAELCLYTTFKLVYIYLCINT